MLIYSSDASGNLTAEAPGTLAAPQIVGQPVDQLVSAGDFASFSVVVANTSGVTFQWAFNGTDIAGASGDSLLLPAVSAANVGQYSVTVTNSAGSVTSAPATLAHDSGSTAQRFGTHSTRIRPRKPSSPARRSAGAHRNRLYQLHNNGKIWQFQRPGSTAVRPSHYGWILIDQNPATTAITAAGNNLYQLRQRRKSCNTPAHRPPHGSCSATTRRPRRSRRSPPQETISISCTATARSGNTRTRSPDGSCSATTRRPTRSPPLETISIAAQRRQDLAIHRHTADRMAAARRQPGHQIYRRRLRTRPPRSAAASGGQALSAA